MDQTFKKAIYNALRSNDTSRLSTLLNTTEIEPENFVLLLSETYEEVKLKNIPISEDIQFMAEYKLLDLQFIGKNSTKSLDDDFKTSFIDIKDHLDFVCMLMKSLLKKQDLEVNSEFVHHSRYLAQHLSVLKGRLHYTYDVIPWEEMQFCLATFVHVLKEPENSEIIYELILNKNRVLNYLRYFHEELEEINERFTEEDLSKRQIAFNRNQIKESVLKKSSKFEDLYIDFAFLRDIYSLNKINNYISKALRVNFKENGNVGQLVVERSLQVIGEYIKNTPDSPNLSEDLYKILLKSAPRNLKVILANLRNMLSHSFSLTRKLELESSKDPDFFEKVQNDLRKIQVDITYILYKQKVEAVKEFLRRFLDMEDIKYLRIILNKKNIETIKEMTSFTINLEEFLKVKELIDLFCEKIEQESNEYFEEIEDIQNSFEAYEMKVRNVSSTYAEVLNKVYELINMDKNENIIKNMLRTYLSLLSNSEPENLYKDVFLKIRYIQENLQTKRNSNKDIFLDSNKKLDEIGKIIIEIYGYIKLRLRSIKFIEEIEDNLTFKEEAINDKHNKANEIFEMIENKLEAIEDKTLVKELIKNVKKRHSIKNELKIDSILNANNTEFENKILLLNLSVKRQKEILNNYEKKNFDRLQLMIKEIDDAYGTFLKKFGDMFPLVKFVSNIKEFYESLKFKNAFKKKLNAAIDEAINERIIKCYKERLNKLKAILIDKRNDLIMTSLEMLVLDLMEFLKNVNMLSDNKFLLVKNSSILMGKQLRDFLAHGDILIDLLPYDSKISIIYHAEKLVKATENILSEKHVLLGHKADAVDFSFQKYFKKCQKVIALQTRLFESAKNENFQKIIDNGADIYGRAFNNWGIFNFIIKENNDSLFKLVINIFLHHESDLKEILEFAIKEGSLEITQYLIDKLLINTNSKFKINNKTLLNLALEYGQEHVAEFLIKIGLKPDYNDLIYASENGHLKIIQLFTEDNETVCDYSAALKLSIKKGNLNAVTNLLDTNLKNPKNIMELINISAQYNHTNILRYLLKTFKIYPDLTEAIIIATKHGNLNIVEFLIKISTNENVISIIYLTASQYGHLNIITWLIKKNINLHVKDPNNRTVLHLATQCGHYHVVEHLLQYEIDPNIQDKSGWTCMHWASYSKHLKLIKLLIKKNANAFIQDEQGQTAFHLAAANGEVDILTVLIQYDIKLINITTKKGQTALHLAAQNGHDNVAKLLIKTANVDVNATNNIGETALIVATDNGHNDIVLTLLKHNAVTSCKSIKDGRSPLTIAASHGHIDIVNNLIKFKANMEIEEESGWRAIHWAVQNGYDDIFDALLKQHVDINAKFKNGGTALHTVVRYGYTHIVRKLIAHGADVNALFFNVMLPLRVAAHFGQNAIIKLLLASGAEVDDVGNDKVTPLHSACISGHIETVKLLIKNGANVNVQNDEHWTALHFAAKQGFSEIVKLLLENSADMFAENKFNQNVFHTACEAGHSNIVKMLLDTYKIDASITGQDGVGGLHWASANNHFDIVETLIKKNINVNLISKDGSTALHWAVDNLSSIKIIEALLKNNAKVNVHDHKGATPLHLAAVKGKIEVVEELLKNHADVNSANKNIAALHLAVAQGYCQIVEVLIKFKANVNMPTLHNKTSLHIALEGGYTDIAKILIANEADVNLKDVDGFNALHSAAQKGYKDIVEILIKLTKDVSICTFKAQTALELALEHQHEEVAKALINNKVDVRRRTVDGYTYLHLACKKGMLDVVLALLEQGLDVNQQCQLNKLTPLHIALHFDHKDISNILINNHADLNLYSINGWTALHAASNKGFKDLVLELIIKNADINAKTKNSETPLHFASIRGYYDIVQILLNYSAMVDVKTISKEMTALSMAAQEGHVKILKILIEHDADINARSSQGLTPLHISALYGHKECVMLLLDKKADLNSLTDNGWTVLQMAVAEGFIDIVDILLENSIENINHKNCSGDRAIDLAKNQGHAGVVDRLLKYIDVI